MSSISTTIEQYTRRQCSEIRAVQRPSTCEVRASSGMCTVCIER